MSVIKRLRKVDSTLANRVSRRKIGSLQGRLYFQPHGSEEPPAEVPIHSFQDNGISAAPWATGESIVAHRFTVQVSGNWWDLNRSIQGEYFVTQFDEDEMVSVDVDNETTNASDTFTTLNLAVMPDVELQDNLPPLE